MATAAGVAFMKGKGEERRFRRKRNSSTTGEILQPRTPGIVFFEKLVLSWRK
jgi:hypothetical protein